MQQTRNLTLGYHSLSTCRAAIGRTRGSVRQSPPARPPFDAVNFVRHPGIRDSQTTDLARSPAGLDLKEAKCTIDFITITTKIEYFSEKNRDSGYANC